jgi:predicted dehydrogenase
MDRKLGVGIAGTGWVSGEHIKAFRQNPNTEVIALMNPDRGLAEAKIREMNLGQCRIYTDLDEMLKSGEIDIVSVCTPHHLHASIASAAADAGKHVVIEKPIALNLDELRSLRCAVEKNRVKSVVGFVLRWNPLFDNIKAMLADQTIGKVFYSEVDYLHATDSSYGGFEWISQKKYGGSSMLSVGCHAVDALRWFVGSEAVEVMGCANFSQDNRLKYEYEPNCVCLIKFADGTIGKVASSMEAVLPYTFNILLLGDRGTIRNNQVFTKRWPGQTNWATVPTITPDSGDVSHHPFVGEIDHLVDCILNDKESHCNVADAVKTHEICLAAEISAREGRPVRLPL